MYTGKSLNSGQNKMSGMSLPGQVFVFYILQIHN